MSIVYDFPGVATHFKDDKWWTPEKPAVEPKGCEVQEIATEEIDAVDRFLDAALLQQPVSILPGHITYQRFDQGIPYKKPEPADVQTIAGVPWKTGAIEDWRAAVRAVDVKPAKKPEPEPAPIEPFGISPAMVLMADLRAEMVRMQEEIVRGFAVPQPAPVYTPISQATWRALNEAKPARCPKCGPVLLCAEHMAMVT